MAAPEIRILTLVGPGGIGKTRLGIEVATQARAAFRDGAFFVSLAVTDDPGLVPSLIAREIRLTGIRTSVPDALRKHLRDHEALLVLDTFEHVLPAAPFVAELAAECPRLTILVTSRAPLRIRGEHVIGVAPLEVPEAGVSPAHLDRYAATALFVERVGQVKPDLVIDLGARPAPFLAAVRRRLLAALQRRLTRSEPSVVGPRASGRQSHAREIRASASPVHNRLVGRRGGRLAASERLSRPDPVARQGDGGATLHGADLARSQTLLEEAVRRYRKLGDKLFVARTIGYLGYASR